jgi:hypothetical protein
VVVQLSPAAVHRVETAAPRMGQGQVPAPPPPVVPPLPAGITHEAIGTGSGFPSIDKPTPPNDASGATQPVYLTVNPHNGKCTGADIAAGPASNPATVSRSVVICQP